MSNDSQPISRSLLRELYQHTQGDLQQTVSMYDLGASLGLAKAAAGAAAEELMVEGLVELRTLAGGISITAEGLAALGIARPEDDARESPGRRLGAGPLLDNGDREVLTQLLAVLRRAPVRGTSLGQLEEMLVDLKTLEVQLLSPAAKTAIVREVLRSLHAAFEKCDDQAMAKEIHGLLG